MFIEYSKWKMNYFVHISSLANALHQHEIYIFTSHIVNVDLLGRSRSASWYVCMNAITKLQLTSLQFMFQCR
jgi:hypothetical protein